MTTLEELVNKFRTYSDEELFDIYTQINEYTDMGREAFQKVVEERGGIDSLKDRIAKQMEITNEIAKIKGEVVELLKANVDITEIKHRVKTNYISQEQFEKIVEETKIELALQKSDLEIKPRTVIGSIIGGIVGGTIGGILWGIQMVVSNHMFMIFAIGLALLSYGCIRLFTRQSKRNIVVLIVTILSVIYALALGQLIYEIFGNVS